MREVLWVALAGVVGSLVAVALYARRSDRRLVTPGQRMTYEALHTANLAAPHIRAGLTADAMHRALGPLRSLLGTDGVVVADSTGIITSEGVDEEHRRLLRRPVETALASGRPSLLSGADLRCDRAACALSAGVIAPLHVEGRVVGALVALGPSASAGLMRLCGEVAQFVSTQLELAELDRSRQRAVQAELRFLRAQISPHFIYNALTAIESFVRSDPDRARELLVSFAEFTRYSFASHAQYTTLAEELRLVDIYLDLERARFGDRMDVTLRVAPEVLSVRLPSLVLQPVVENAIRHGLEPAGHGHLRIDISDADSDACITVEDDGAGAEPRRLERALSGTTASVGLRNVDERLRATFGDNHGLLVETAPGAGTKVTFSVPKFHFAAGTRVG
ncbi:MAG TPA: histidine kinase [Acidimicrobiales bacterium]|nr:histidine kinase [Acidimicrobiales bacterium]